MRKLIAASLTALLVMGCAATPEEDSASVPASRYENTADAKRAADDDDVICTYEKRVGSHMKEAICMTKKQREANTENSQEQARQLDRRRAGTRNQ